MDIATLNEILKFINADFRATKKLPVSGQREVFYGNHISKGNICTLKGIVINPINVGRTQREIRVLESLDTEYFPKPLFNTFITDTILADFYDSFNPHIKEQKQRLGELHAMQIKPFLLTAEEYIDHVLWEDQIEKLKDQNVLVQFLIHVFQALALLWDAKIAHRDLKPANILLRPDLRPVIIDLGIAKSFRPGTCDFTIFKTPCTPQFAAPEQLTNTKTEITYKTDQFAVGVIAFILLTGRFPYGDALEIQEKIFDNFSQGKMDNIRDYHKSIDERLAKFIEKLLQVHPYKRFRNTDSILKRLNEIGN